MGNTQNWVAADISFPSEQQLLGSLMSIDDGENDNQMLALGRFKIFRLRTEPYEIIMKHVQTFTPNNPRFLEYQEAAKTIAARLDHKNIAKIHSINICKRSSLCSEQISIESYVNYYGLDFQSVIEQRKREDRRFRAEQMWYVLNSLVDLAVYLQKMEIFFGIFLPKNVFLSPEGYIKVYLYHCTPQNQHLLYYYLIGHDTRDMHKFLPLAPECLPLLEKKAQFLTGISNQKMDIFGIGTIALEAMLFNPTRRYYLNNSENDFSLTFDTKQLDVDFQELRQVYPQKLVNLVEKMTKINPNERFSFFEAQQYIRNIRQQISMSGSIRMLEEQAPSTSKLSYKFTSKNCRQILKSIISNGQNKLQYVPLKNFSKDKYNSCHNKHHSLVQSQATKNHKLQLSTLTLGQRSSRMKEWKESRMLSSFR